MAKAKQGFKRKRSKTALPVWAAAGVSLAITGGASANAPVTEMPSQDSGKRLLLAEEEVFDVSLGTFYVFDKEREFSPGVRLAALRIASGSKTAPLRNGRSGIAVPRRNDTRPMGQC